MKKIAVITGGSRGLGKSMALHLAAQGVDIIFTYKNQRQYAEGTLIELEKLGAKAKAVPLAFDNPRGFEEFSHKISQLLTEEWQREQIDYLINNAGHGLHKPMALTNEEEFDGLMNVHFKGVFFLTQTLLPLLKDGGRILNISSGLTRFSLPGMSAYAAMKGAVEVLTRYLAKELASRNIRVNVLAPGAIATDFSGGVVRDNAEMNQQVAAMTALGRVGKAEDIGGIVAILLSEQSHWITGQRIEASGGMFL